MTRQVLLHRPTITRCQSHVPSKTQVAGGHASGGGNRCAEVAGRSAADCAAVACCCPCTVMDLLVLAVYKVPAGLCRKAARRKRQRRAGFLAQRQGNMVGPMGSESDAEAGEDSVADLIKKGGVGDAAEDLELEKEMWAQFSGAGFWRSPSQKEE